MNITALGNDNKTNYWRRSVIAPGPMIIAVCLVLRAADAASESISPGDLSRMSLEELTSIEISSVSRRAEPLIDAAASVYVITREDIRRYGATNIPELLRLAPNLQVAKVDSSQYAISARGFNSTTANKLEVLIDGRSVYTPAVFGRILGCSGHHDRRHRTY